MGRTIRQRRWHRGQHDRAATALVYLHASTFQVGALSAAQWVPWLLIGLPTGGWVDRSRRHRLMLGCDVLRAVLIGSIPVAAAFHRLGMAQLFVVALLTGTLRAVRDDPAGRLGRRRAGQRARRLAAASAG